MNKNLEQITKEYYELKNQINSYNEYLKKEYKDLNTINLQIKNAQKQLENCWNKLTVINSKFDIIQKEFDTKKEENFDIDTLLKQKAEYENYKIICEKTIDMLKNTKNEVINVINQNARENEKYLSKLQILDDLLNPNENTPC